MRQLRPFTFDEWMVWQLLAERIRDEVDVPLADIMTRIGQGDDGAIAELHDRLAVLGKFKLADRIRRLMVGE